MKRFTETSKWDSDVWFSELEPRYKLFWLYLIDKCDNVGVWEVNMKAANFFIGYDYSIDSLIKVFDGKVLVIDDGKKWWIRSFIDFQHGILDPDSTSKPILSYFKLLEKHNLSKEYTKGIHTLQGKGKGKGKVVKKDKNAYTEDFELFWSAYPNKKSKGGAFKAWEKASDKPENIVAIIEKQKQWHDWKKDGGQYIPMPATWLNGARWADEETISESESNQMTPEEEAALFKDYA